jgi:hypothetical protein
VTINPETGREICLAIVSPVVGEEIFTQRLMNSFVVHSKKFMVGKGVLPDPSLLIAANDEYPQEAA